MTNPNREKLGLHPGKLLGMSEIDASYECTVNGVFYNVVKRDDVTLPVTEDVLPAKRVNVEVKRGIIFAVGFDAENFRPE